MVKTGAQNAVTDDSFGMEAPVTQVDELALADEAKKAKYSKTKEFKEIMEYWQARKKFFQLYTPSGAEIRFQIPDENVAQQWVLANNMINEIDAFLSNYTLPAETMKDAA